MTPLILIAEDEADAARLVSYRLQRKGYRTLVAEDGLATINAAFEKHPDLVILDLMMPKMHGLEVCRLLKNSPTTRTVPVLILSALAGMEDKLKGFGRGADDYMTKPFEMPELIARVESLLQRSAGTKVEYHDNPTDR
jgi:DNA-binding response OmpR family regulator